MQFDSIVRSTGGIFFDDLKSFYFLFQHILMSELLQLTCNCLSFDFIGTASDESVDELGAVQIPTTWREGNHTCSF